MSTTQIHYNAAKYGQSGRKPHVLSIGRYNSIWSYTFSAKERDTETGYSVTSLRSVSSSSLSQAQTSLAWHSLIRRFGSRYYSSDLSIWLSVDPMAHKYPSLSPYVYCANNPVKLVDPNGEEVGIPPFLLGGIRALFYRKRAESSTLTISNNIQAVRHYYYGNGNTVNLDSKFATTLMNTKAFKGMHQNITSGTNIDKNGDLITSGSFGVDMTCEKNAFFIGKTGVKYNVATSTDKKTCTVTYTFFTKGDNPDNFSDPNFLMERSETAGKDSSGRTNRSGHAGDDMGPELELGGVPYKFNTQEKKFTFKNPGGYE